MLPVTPDGVGAVCGTPSICHSAVRGLVLAMTRMSSRYHVPAVTVDEAVVTAAAPNRMVSLWLLAW